MPHGSLASTGGQHARAEVRWAAQLGWARTQHRPGLPGPAPCLWRQQLRGSQWGWRNPLVGLLSVPCGPSQACAHYGEHTAHSLPEPLAGPSLLGPEGAAGPLAAQDLWGQLCPGGRVLVAGERHPDHSPTWRVRGDEGKSKTGGVRIKLLLPCPSLLITPAFQHLLFGRPCEALHQFLLLRLSPLPGLPYTRGAPSQGQGLQQLRPPCR